MTRDAWVHVGDIVKALFQKSEAELAAAEAERRQRVEAAMRKGILNAVRREARRPARW